MVESVSVVVMVVETVVLVIIVMNVVIESPDTLSLVTGPPSVW